MCPVNEDPPKSGLVLLSVLTAEKGLLREGFLPVEEYKAWRF
jgi:hypothetical protein